MGVHHGHAICNHWSDPFAVPESTLASHTHVRTLAVVEMRRICWLWLRASEMPSWLCPRRMRSRKEKGRSPSPIRPTSCRS